ncbi:MAG: HTH domain-containing protein [candidate division Zixibacteria bacterium]|nr:HTH domain-containing protein [candidate division Zixibacteria bacterium]
MEQLTFLELTKKILKEERKPLTHEEIWELAKIKGYDKYVGSKGKTPWITISAQLYVNIRDKKDKSPFVKIGSRPRRFYLRELMKEGDESRIIEEQPVEVLPPKKLGYLEKDLHPFLAYYGNYFLNSFLKTIQHTRSDRGEFREWLHPDMVGCYFSMDEWKPEVFELSSTTGNNPIKIYSFEIKRELNFSNLRESFFQTVSNSSWANEGYLAASEISNDEEFQKELERLSSSFGIGVIKIDIEDPDSTKILFPAKPREYLDWDTVNKLTVNADFREFLIRVKTDLTSKEVRKEKYDKILSREELQRIILKN